MDFGKMNATIPATTRRYYGDNELAQNKAVMIQIDANYGKMIREAAYQNELEPALIGTLIFIESRGDLNARNGNTYGLCQISVATVANTLFKDFKEKRITVREEELLEAFLGKSDIEKIKSAKADTAIVPLIEQQLLLNPNFNILLGTMYFRRCIDKVHALGYGFRIELAIYLYNRGYFSAIPTTLNIESFLDSTIPAVTKSYILKFMGQNSPYPDAKQIFG